MLVIAQPHRGHWLARAPQVVPQLEQTLVHPPLPQVVAPMVAPLELPLPLLFAQMLPGATLSADRQLTWRGNRGKLKNSFFTSCWQYNI